MGLVLSACREGVQGGVPSAPLGIKRIALQGSAWAVKGADSLQI